MVLLGLLECAAIAVCSQRQWPGIGRQGNFWSHLGVLGGYLGFRAHMLIQSYSPAVAISSNGEAVIDPTSAQEVDRRECLRDTCFVIMSKSHTVVSTTVRAVKGVPCSFPRFLGGCICSLHSIVFHFGFVQVCRLPRVGHTRNCLFFCI